MAFVLHTFPIKAPQQGWPSEAMDAVIILVPELEGGAGKAGSGVTLTQLSHSGVCCRPVLVRISSVNSFGVISSSSLV